jgi:hypothetical protein
MWKFEFCANSGETVQNDRNLCQGAALPISSSTQFALIGLNACFTQGATKRGKCKKEPPFLNTWIDR